MESHSRIRNQRRQMLGNVEISTEGHVGHHSGVARVTAQYGAFRGQRAADVRAGQLSFADVGQDIRISRLSTATLPFFQGPLLLGRINLAQIVDARIGLRGLTGLHKVRNRNRRQQADDGHDNHDFHQGETRVTDVFGLFHFVLLSLSAAELRIRRFI